MQLASGRTGTQSQFCLEFDSKAGPFATRQTRAPWLMEGPMTTTQVLRKPMASPAEQIYDHKQMPPNPASRAPQLRKISTLMPAIPNLCKPPYFSLFFRGMMFWGIQRGFQFAHLHLLICRTNIYWAPTVYQMLVLGAFRVVTQISPGRRQSPLLLHYRWERQAGSLPKFAWLVNSRTAVWTQVVWPRACGFCSKSWQLNEELETWKDSCEGETGKRRCGVSGVWPPSAVLCRSQTGPVGADL